MLVSVCIHGSQTWHINEVAKFKGFAPNSSTLYVIDLAYGKLIIHKTFCYKFLKLLITIFILNKSSSVGKGH